jgi:hypothetical protein
LAERDEAALDIEDVIKGGNEIADIRCRHEAFVADWTIMSSIGEALENRLRLTKYFSS